MIGTLRRECFDHVIVLNASHARKILTSDLLHYHRWRHDTEEPMARRTNVTNFQEGQQAQACGFQDADGQ